MNITQTHKQNSEREEVVFKISEILDSKVSALQLGEISEAIDDDNKTSTLNIIKSIMEMVEGEKKELARCNYGCDANFECNCIVKTKAHNQALNTILDNLKESLNNIKDE